MKSSAKTKQNIRDICYIALFAALLAVCSWLSIPGPVSFTLQTFGVFLAIGVLGGRRGTIAVLLYIVLGAIGLPVFAGFSGGMGALLGATGGYIVGFLFSALFMWLFEKLFGQKTPILVLSMVIGLLICYAFGTAWFVYVYNRDTGAMGVGAALMACVVPFLIPDGIKILLAAFLTKRLKPLLKLDRPAPAAKKNADAPDHV